MKQNHYLSSEPILPGLKPVLELLRENPDKIVKILHKKNLQTHDAQSLSSLARKAGMRIEEASQATLDLLCGPTVSHQGVVAILARAEILTLQELFDCTAAAPLPLIIALDQIQDQGNLGAITRTAYALGCGGILMGRHECASPGPGAYRASAGALGKLPFSIAGNLGKALDLAEENGYTIYGSVSQKDCPANTQLESIWEARWNFPAILVLGNENRGIRPGIMKRCGKFLTIPFARDFDSLNIAQAGAIFISQASHFLYTLSKSSQI